MSKMNKVTGRWLRVDVSPGWLSKDPVPSAGECARVMSEIRRHVDGASCDVEEDRMDCCDCCGSPWTEESDTFNGGCCSEDRKNDPLNGESA